MIGSHIVDALPERGEEVVVFDDFSTGKRENLEGVRRTRLVEGSVVDPTGCGEAIDGADYVLHQAALGSVPRSIPDTKATHEVNLTGTLNVLVATREAGVRRVMYAASSSACENISTLPKQEEMRPNRCPPTRLPSSAARATDVPSTPRTDFRRWGYVISTCSVRVRIWSARTQP